MTTPIFKQIDSLEPVAEYLATQIAEKLAAGKKVLWLVPGGSGIVVASAASKLLAGKDLQNLTVSLTDERYDEEIDHQESDWQGLIKAGFDLPGARLIPVLTGQDRKATTQAFAEKLVLALQLTDYHLGFFGIGPDGHTAGILPHSPAATSPDLISDYDAGKFQRITTTPRAIAMMHEVVVYAVGTAKKDTLEMLRRDIPFEEQPAQALKQAPVLTIFTDQLNP